MFYFFSQEESKQEISEDKSPVVEGDDSQIENFEKVEEDPNLPHDVVVHEDGMFILQFHEKKNFNNNINFFSVKLQHLQDHVLNFDQGDFKQKRSNSRKSR